MSSRLHILVPIIIVFISSLLTCCESAALSDDNPELYNRNSQVLTRNTRQAIKSDYPVVIYNGRLYVPENWQLLFRYGFKFFVRILKNTVGFNRSNEPFEYEDDEDVSPRKLPEDDFVDDTTVLPSDDAEMETTTIIE
ncbi:hypothetical protein ACKWTF_016352 [Chironomus riparius]